MQQESVNSTTVSSSKFPCKNKKKHTLNNAILYDNMVSTSYTLYNGELNKEKITQQSYSFTKR